MKRVSQSLPMDELHRSSRDELFDKKQKQYNAIAATCEQIFGTKEIPREILSEALAIRRMIAKDVVSEGYSTGLTEGIFDQIALFAARISFFEEQNEFVEVVVSDTGITEVVLKDGQRKELDAPARELIHRLSDYFDAYRMAQNAVEFRTSIRSAAEKAEDEITERTRTFYSAEEREDYIVESLTERYKKLSLSDEELRSLVRTSSIKDFSKIPISEISLFSKIQDIFSRYMKGDTTPYIALSAALTVPAFIQGYAPMILANSFKSDRIDLVQVVLYAFLTTGAAGLSASIDKFFKDFLQKNFSKKGGLAQNISENVTLLPAEEIDRFGRPVIKERINTALGGYESLMRTVSADIMPAVVTLSTSAYMLYDKSPLLAGGTIAGAGLIMTLDKFARSKMKFWQRLNAEQQENERVTKQLEEQISAHLEVTLSGERERFMQDLELRLAASHRASADKQFMRVLQGHMKSLYTAINFVVAGVATALSGGSPDRFVAALVYSSNFIDGLSNLLSTKMQLASNLRDIVEMDRMFNGFAQEERTNEKKRKGVSTIRNHDIRLSHLTLAFKGKKVLDDLSLSISQGACVSLEGVSGAGKTSLMKILAGYYQPSEGEATLGGISLSDIKKEGPDALYTKIAYVSQFPYLLEGSIRENLLFGLPDEMSVSDNVLHGILQEVGLEKRFRNLDEGIMGGRGDEGAASGGEAQRLGLARALLKLRMCDVKIAFFDEPTASVDEETSFEIAGIINKEKERVPQTTFIVVSHNKSFLKELNLSKRIRIAKGKSLE